MTDKNAMANPALKLPIDLRAQMMAAMNDGARELFRLYMPRVLDTAPLIERQIDKASKDAGIDPKYTRWLLGRPHLWPSIVASDKGVLLLAARILTKAGVTVPYEVMEPSTNDLAQDMVLSDLADWSKRNLLPLLQKHYIKAGWPVARKHADTLRLPNDSTPDAQQAVSKISRYLEYLLTEKRIGSPNGGLVLSVLGFII